MPKTQHITARVEPKLKENAEAVLRRLGMNTTGAITMFLQQVVLHEGLPFPVKVPVPRPLNDMDHAAVTKRASLKLPRRSKSRRV